jgi:protein ImuB
LAIPEKPMRPRRVISLWFPRLASERYLRGLACAGPFAVVLRAGRGDLLHCLTPAAEAAGLRRGMALADARALCPGLVTRPADPLREAGFLRALVRWAGRWSPRVGREGADGLVLDASGVAHLFGGEAALADEIAASAARGGLTLGIGLADSRGAAWALARHAARPGPGGAAVAAPGAPLAALGGLPVAALRLEPETVAALDRLGLRRIRDLAVLPRATLARRFGMAAVVRLDQALGAAPEPLTPEAAPPHFGVRLTLPEPIGLVSDLAAGLDRLLARLCPRLDRAGQGARRLRLEMRRVDGSDAAAEIGLARPMRDPAAIAALFRPALDTVEAGFGIDRLRLVATAVEAMPARQVEAGRPEGRAQGESGPAAAADRMADLVTRLGNRLGFDNLQRLLPAESHIPERGFLVAAAAWSEPAEAWPAAPPRPLVLFPPEPAEARGGRPPRRLRWRGRTLEVARAEGPERIAPEWWFDDPAWRTGLRDYWQVETACGRRLWLFHTPQGGEAGAAGGWPGGWSVQGEFA